MSCLSLAAGAALGLSSPLVAAERLWIDPTGGGFTDSTNWSGGIAPGVGDSGRFSIGGGFYFVGLGQDYDVDRIVVSSDTVNFPLGGNVLTCLYNSNEDDASLIIGDTPLATGVLSISSGTLQSIYASIGESGGAGVLTLESGSVSWVNAARIAVGNSGHGTLGIGAGADVLNGPAFIGKYAGSVGIVGVTGLGSTWDTEAGLAIGSAGTGTLLIQGAGYAEANLVYVGRFETGDGTLTVDGNGSEFFANGTLNVGLEGHGVLEAKNNGKVNATTINVGVSETGDGEVVVNTSTGSISAAVAINIGQSGAASLLVSTGKLAAPQVNIGVGASAIGMATLRSGGFIESSAVAVGINGILDGDGLVLGPLNNAGSVEPGFPIGKLTVTGSYNQAAGLGGSLVISVNGPTPITEHDVLTIGGSATLGGAITVQFEPGATLMNGDVYEFLTATSVSGEFTTVAFDGLPAGVVAEIQYTPTSARVAISTQSADLTGDGIVDGVDLAEFLAFWGPCPGDCPSDFNGDGIVDGPDLAFLLASWTI